jgi:hypothetical protein
MVLIVFTCPVALKLATNITAKNLRVRRILFPNIPAEKEQNFREIIAPHQAHTHAPQASVRARTNRELCNRLENPETWPDIVRQSLWFAAVVKVNF